MDDKSLTEIGEKIVKQKRPKRSEQMQVQTEPGDNARFISHALQISQMPKIDTSNVEQVEARLNEYFQLCAMNDMRPNVPSMALSLGIDRRTLWR